MPAKDDIKFLNLRSAASSLLNRSAKIVERDGRFTVEYRDDDDKRCKKFFKTRDEARNFLLQHRRAPRPGSLFAALEAVGLNPTKLTWGDVDLENGTIKFSTIS